VPQPVFLFGKIKIVCEQRSFPPIPTSALLVYTESARERRDLGRKKPQPSENRELGRATYGVENANTWWELLVPQTPPPLPTVMETSEPGTCTKFNAGGTKRKI
jgi:hypothetical protein